MTDLIEIIETAYRFDIDEQTWLSELVSTLSPAFAKLAPASGYVYNVDFARPRMNMGAFASCNPDIGTQQVLDMNAGRSSTSLRKAYLECDVLSTLSSAVGAEARETPNFFGHEDVLGLRANSDLQSGVILLTVVKWQQRISQRDRDLWTRVAAHIGTAHRLRQRLAPKSPVLDGAQAVFSPGGKVEHLASEAEPLRQELARSAGLMERARGRLRRADPEQALALWQAMVSGQYSLVDCFDHDGKRFIVARENPVPGLGPERALGLSPREWHVLACAAMGHPNKLIAYDLGLSTTAVSSFMRRAARKMGVGSRVELIRRYHELMSDPPAAD